MKSETAPWLLFAAAALAAGVALRTIGLREQIALDDELVSIAAPLAHPYSLLFGRFDAAYYSIPHALILKLLADGVGLDELTLRLPSLVAGLALLIGAPWIVWRRFGAAPAGVFAALLSFSPLLVLYSRIARAYAIGIALVFFALMALERWLAERKPGHALAYVSLSTLAVWFHQLTAPALMAPLALATGLCALDAPPGRRWRELAAPLWMGLAVTLLVVALLWNALFVSLGPLVTKMDRVPIGGLTLLGAMALFAGTRELWLVGLFWLAAALGCALALRRHFRLAALLLASALGQWLCVQALGPWLAEAPHIFARYVAWSLPCVLMFLALALSQLGRLRLAGRAWPLPALASALFVAALVRTGPLPSAWPPRTNFAAHPDLLIPPLRLPEVSPFYRRLREEPGDFAIVEAPLRNSPALVPYPVYQRVHGKRVRIGFLGSLSSPPNADEFSLADPRVAFRSFVDLAGPAALHAVDARYLVLHRDLGRELGFPTLSFDVEPAIGELERRLGPPVYSDADLAVFALR